MEPVVPDSFWIAWMVMFDVYAIVATTAFAHRGICLGLQPIKAREPFLIIVSSICEILWTTLLCLQRVYSDTYPCLIQLWTAFLGGIVLFNVYMLRAFMLYLNFNLTRSRVQMRQNANFMLGSIGADSIASRSHRPLLRVPIDNLDRVKMKHTFFGNIQRKMTVKNVCAFQTLCAIVLLFAPLGFTMAFDDLRIHRGDDCFRAWHGAAWVLACYSVVYLVIFIFIGIELLGKFDAFGIKNELKWVGLCCLPCIVVWYPLNNIPDAYFHDFNKRVPISTLVLLGGVAFAFTVSTFIPLLQSCHEKPEQTADKPESIDTLQKLMLSREGAQSFHNYMTDEFAVQHLYFFADVEALAVRRQRYKKRGLNRKRVEKFVEICLQFYDIYIGPEADLVINIGKRQKAPITALVANLRRNRFPAQVQLTNDRSIGAEAEAVDIIMEIFLKIQREVYKSLRDSFRRFKRSEKYGELIENLNTQRERAARMQGSRRSQDNLSSGLKSARSKRFSHTIRDPQPAPSPETDV
eukprot:370959_1